MGDDAGAKSCGLVGLLANTILRRRGSRLDTRCYPHLQRSTNAVASSSRHVIGLVMRLERSVSYDDPVLLEMKFFSL